MLLCGCLLSSFDFRKNHINTNPTTNIMFFAEVIAQTLCVYEVRNPCPLTGCKHIYYCCKVRILREKSVVTDFCLKWTLEELQSLSLQRGLHFSAMEFVVVVGVCCLAFFFFKFSEYTHIKIRSICVVSYFYSYHLILFQCFSDYSILFCIPDIFLSSYILLKSIWLSLSSVNQAWTLGSIPLLKKTAITSVLLWPVHF